MAMFFATAGVLVGTPSAGSLVNDETQDYDHLFIFM
jgi:hypothetical protein